MINKEKIYPYYISGLSIFASQILQGILFYLFIASFQNLRNTAVAGILVLLPSLLSVFAGGVCQGRLLSNSSLGLRAGAGLLNAALPAIFQVAFAGGEIAWLTDVSTLLSIVSGVLIWISGAWLGTLTQTRNPSAHFDKMLRNITAGAAVVLMTLYLFTWSSVHFSRANTLAQAITLPVPPAVTELPNSAMSPEILTGKRFEVVQDADDASICQFYQEEFSLRGYEDVTGDFQVDPACVWTFNKEEIGDRRLEFQSAGAHWVEPEKEVLISLVLQGEKVNPDTDWPDTLWKVHGMIVTLPYAPPKPENIAKPAKDNSANQEAPGNPVADSDTEPMNKIGE